MALITGASSGIGAAFARRLASEGYGLVLVARRDARLRSLAGELEREFRIHAGVFPADLSDAVQVKRLETRISGIQELEILVNNAGFGVPGEFAEIEAGQSAEMIQVHVVAAVRLCRAALPGMISRGRGMIINVSSIAAFMAGPKNVTYSATKAYLNLFSEGLRDELEGTGVRIQALCPGLTHTEFHDRPGYEDYKKKIPEFLWMTAEEVVGESLDSLEKNRALCIPGFKNRLIVLLIRNRPGAFLVKKLAARFQKA
jgi:hypothetical protein